MPDSPTEGLVIVAAAIQQVPPDNTGRHDLTSDVIRTEAISYEEGQEMLLRQVPSGWRVIWWRSEPVG